jgi:hypothetical protein
MARKLNLLMAQARLRNSKVFLYKFNIIVCPLGCAIEKKGSASASPGVNALIRAISPPDRSKLKTCKLLAMFWAFWFPGF